MTLTDDERDRLADVRELQPTTNGELADRWGMDSGSDVARYLREHLSGHTYRGEDKRIRVDGDTDTDSSESDSSGTERSGSGERGESDPNPSDGGGGSDTGGTTATVDSNGDGMELSGSEIDDVVAGAKEAGIEEGYQAGRHDPHPDVAGGSDPVANAPDTGSTNDDETKCPDCGRPLSEIDWFDPAELGLRYDYGCAHCSTSETLTVWSA